MAFGLSAASVLQLLAQYKYEFLVPGALLIGPLISLTAGVLIRLGVMDLWTTAFILMATELLGDVFWYWVGDLWGEGFVRRVGHFIGITEARVHVIRRLFHVHHDKIIIISKLTAGFGFAPAIYFTAGLSHVPFRRYMGINIAGQIVWTSAMLGTGYYLGHFYLQVNGALERMFFIAGVVVMFAAVAGAGQYLWSRLMRGPEA